MARSRTTRREDGAVLVLALVFMIVIALVLLGRRDLVGERPAEHVATSSTEQSLEYRSSGAMRGRHSDGAIHRYDSFTGTSRVSPPPPAFRSATNSPLVYVDCMTVPHSQLPANTGVSREVNVLRLRTSSTSCSPTNYSVWATVDFVDGPTCATGSIGACGTSQSIKSWLVHNANN